MSGGYVFSLELREKKGQGASFRLRRRQAEGEFSMYLALGCGSRTSHTTTLGVRETLPGQLSLRFRWLRA